MCLCVHTAIWLLLPMVIKELKTFRSDMKNEVIKFRVSKIEKKIIEKKSKDAGLTTSDFLRRLAFEKKIKNRLTQEEIIFPCFKIQVVLRNQVSIFRKSFIVFFGRF